MHVAPGPRDDFDEKSLTQFSFVSHLGAGAFGVVQKCVDRETPGQMR